MMLNIQNSMKQKMHNNMIAAKIKFRIDIQLFSQ